MIGLARDHTNPKRLVRHTYLMLLLTGVLTILVTLGMLVMLTNRIDERTALDTRERSSLVITEWQTALQKAVEDYAYWTLAYENISSGDTHAIYDNIGSGATESDLFDWIVILDGNGSVQHTFDFPGTVNAENVLGSAKSSTLLSMLSEHDPFDYLAISGAVSVGGEVSLISAAWVTPDDMTGLDASQLPVLIGGVTLEGTRLTMLQKSTGAASIDIIVAPITNTETDYAFDGPFGISGHLLLTPKTPGRVFRSEILPWLLVFCAAVVAIALSVARYFSHLAFQLNRAIVLASTDPLTGLSNRAAMQTFIQSPWIEQALDQGDIAVLNLDLNRFKQLNDQHGHAAGDVALQVTARRLQDAVRKSDRVVRLGGDEFLCLIVDRNPQKAAAKVADRIVSLFNDPIDFGSFKSDLKASIGIAVGSVGVHWDDLLNRADEAMYQAKKRGDAQPTFHPTENFKPHIA